MFIYQLNCHRVQSISGPDHFCETCLRQGKFMQTYNLKKIITIIRIYLR